MQPNPRTAPPHPAGDGPAATNGQPPTDGRPTDGDGRADRAAHGGDGGEHPIPADLPPVGRGAILVIGLVVLVLFAGLFLLGWGPHSRRQAEAAADAREAAGAKPVVTVVAPKRTTAPVELELPADVQALQSTALFARTNGYLRTLSADLGDDVKAGQVLAEIAAPEVDAELEQSRAALQQAQVTVGRATNEFNFNRSTFDRYAGLSQTGGVTQQQLDERRSAFNIATSSLKAAQANVAAAEAQVKRLTELQGFQRVVAPFDGTVTARNYDVGALISSAAATPGRELFRLDRTDTLRVFASVPQGYAGVVRKGTEAELLVRNAGGRPVKGAVARTSGAIDPATRTLRVEVHVPNADRRLLPGAWGQVRFTIRPDEPSLVVPTSALVFGADGMRVAVVDADGKTVRFRRVTIGRDFGTEAEVTTGLSAGEPVVVNPGDRLVDGVEVEVAKPKGKEAAPPAAAGGAKAQAAAG